MQRGCCDIHTDGLESPRVQRKSRMQSLPSWGPTELSRDLSGKKMNKATIVQENISGLGMQSQNFEFLFINSQMIITSTAFNVFYPGRQFLKKSNKYYAKGKHDWEVKLHCNPREHWAQNSIAGQMSSGHSYLPNHQAASTLESWATHFLNTAASRKRGSVTCDG